MKHEFHTVIEVQSMETAFYRDINGRECIVSNKGEGEVDIEFSEDPLMNFRAEGYHLTRHSFIEGETVQPDNATAMVCCRCGHTEWIVGNEEDFAQECAEKHGIPTCEMRYVTDVMKS